MLFTLALYVRQEAIERFGDVCLVARSLHLMSEGEGEARQVVELLGVGYVVCTIGKYLGFLGGYLADGLGYGPVSQEHELLDKLVSLLGLFEVDAHGVSCLVNVEAYFYTIKVDGTIVETLCTELLGKVIKYHQFVGVLITRQRLMGTTLLTFNDGLNRFVSIAPIAIDDGVS